MQDPVPALIIEQSSDKLIGKLLADNFRVLKRVGVGGMGTVYKAYNEKLQSTVALKVVHQDLATDNKVLLRLQREAKALAMLNHPNILSVHSLQLLDEHRCFLVMEYLEGTDLATELATNGPLSEKRIQHIFKQCTDALGHAHAAGIVHRDIKPNNIMLVKEHGVETVKIVDFGISKTLADMQQSLTQTGTLLGSPLYMSPEQIRGEHATDRSDIYSLGCVLFQAASGVQPFTGDTIVELGYKHLNEPVPPLPNKESAGLSRVIQRATSKDPASRYESMKKFGHAILHGESGSQIQSPMQDTVRYSKRRVFAPPAKSTLIWSVILLVLSSVAAFFLWKTDTIHVNGMMPQEEREPESIIISLMREASSKQALSSEQVAAIGRALEGVVPSHRGLNQMRAAAIFAMLGKNELVDSHTLAALKMSTGGTENDDVHLVVRELRDLAQLRAASILMERAADATAKHVSHNDAKFIWLEYLHFNEDQRDWDAVKHAVNKLAALDENGSKQFYDKSRIELAQAQLLQGKYADTIGTANSWLSEPRPERPPSELNMGWAHLLKARALAASGRSRQASADFIEARNLATKSISDEPKTLDDAKHLLNECNGKP